MLGELFGRSGCGCARERKCPSPMASCDILWIIILLLILFNGGLFGLDICTIVILLVIFGGQFFGREKCCHKG